MSLLPLFIWSENNVHAISLIVVISVVMQGWCLYKTRQFFLIFGNMWCIIRNFVIPLLLFWVTQWCSGVSSIVCNFTQVVLLHWVWYLARVGKGQSVAIQIYIYSWVVGLDVVGKEESYIRWVQYKKMPYTCS